MNKITTAKPAALAADRRVKLAIAHTFKVDRAAGVIADLQLMAAGREAKGHGLYIDDRTLETAHSVVADKGGRLKGYATHNHGGPGTWYWEQDKSELDVAGFFSSISIVPAAAKIPAQLVAGRYEFFESFKKDNQKEYDRMMEMAEKTPDLLGLSVEIWGYAVYVAKDGTEYSQRPEDVELSYDGMPALRVTDMFAAAFVSDGAATDSLFARLGAKVPKGLRELFASLAAGFAEGGDIEHPPRGIPPAPPRTALPQSTPNNETTPSPEISAMQIIKDIKAKFGPNKAAFSQAMTILGEQPDITMQALEAQMVQADLSALRAEVTSLQTKVTDLTTQLGAATKERDEFKSKYETIKASGHGGVDLSAPAGDAGAAAVGGNPWMLGSINETEQCRILKVDPARAASLQAAAAEANKKKK